MFVTLVIYKGSQLVTLNRSRLPFFWHSHELDVVQKHIFHSRRFVAIARTPLLRGQFQPVKSSLTTTYQSTPVLPCQSLSSAAVQQTADHTHGREIVVYRYEFDRSSQFGKKSNWDKQASDVIDKSVATSATLASLLLGHYLPEIGDRTYRIPIAANIEVTPIDRDVARQVLRQTCNW